MNHLKLSFLALLFGLTTACASIDPYRNSAETSLATAGWTQQDTSMAADNIVNKLVNGKKLAGYIQRRPNQETTLYLAQLENKTDEADLDAARVALNAALKDKLVNEAEGFNVIDPENKAIDLAFYRNKAFNYQRSRFQIPFKKCLQMKSSSSAADYFLCVVPISHTKLCILFIRRTESHGDEVVTFGHFQAIFCPVSNRSSEAGISDIRIICAQSVMVYGIVHGFFPSPSAIPD